MTNPRNIPEHTTKIIYLSLINLNTKTIIAKMLFKQITPFLFKDYKVKNKDIGSFSQKIHKEIGNSIVETFSKVQVTGTVLCSKELSQLSLEDKIKKFEVLKSDSNLIILSIEINKNGTPDLIDDINLIISKIIELKAQNKEIKISVLFYHNQDHSEEKILKEKFKCILIEKILNDSSRIKEDLEKKDLEKILQIFMGEKKITVIFDKPAEISKNVKEIHKFFSFFESPKNFITEDKPRKRKNSISGG